MAIKGSLKEAGLADVCQLLALGQKTGCLSISDASRFGQIYFDTGRICFARIVNRRDRLGDLLVRDGVLRQDQLDDVLRKQALEPERRVGELLVSGGLITRQQLTTYVRRQIEEAIYHLFTWSRGSFFFDVDARPLEADILVSINPEALLLEAARRVDEWSLIEKKIPSLDLLFELERARLDAAGVELTPEQLQIIPLLDGTYTVQEIADRTGLAEFEAGKALYGLVQAGFAHRVGRRAEDQTRVGTVEAEERRNLGVAFYRTNMLADAARAFERVLELDRTDVTARYYLALIHLRESRHRDAVRQLRALLEDGGPHYGAFMNLALGLRLLHRFDDALLVLDAADSLRPGAAAIWLARAATLLAAARYAEASQALHSFRAAADGAARLPAQYYHVAALNAALCGDRTAAAQLVEEGLAVHPDAAPLLLLAGLLHERRGELDAAERYYRSSVHEDGRLAEAHKCLGDVSYRRGNHGDALQCYQRAIELNPRLGDDVHARAGNLLYKARNREAAIEHWQKALELNPGNVIVRNNLEIVTHAAE